MKRSALFVIAVMIGALLPLSPAHAAPSIELLNPSDYNPSPELSTKTDIDGAYHFVAWVPSVPADAFVEFEIRPAGGNSVTIEASRVGSGDTFEAFHSLAGLVDGQYTVRAILFSGGTQVGQADEQTVTLRNGMVGQSETAEILFPVNGGQLGFFTPKDGLPRALVDVRTSDAARQVRVLFTTSRPGTDPEWVQCGSGAVSGASASVRCTLPANTAFAAVTAIAAIANQTPPPTAANAAADDAGDAHRVTTFASVPSRVVIDPEAAQTKVSECSSVFVARVLDQQSRPVVGANVDVHAVGPNDQLQFAAIANATSDFQPPNSGPHSTENTRRCSDLAPAGMQGETNRVGQADEKHIESRASGTNNNGAFTFALFSDSLGGATISVWADENDDDVQVATEASGGSRLGFGQSPPPPLRQVFLEPGNSSATVGDCQRFVLTAKESGNALPGANVDVHASGEGATFCSPDDASPSRVPDSGEHVAGIHSDGTRHIEGELDSFGRFVFGVSTASEAQLDVFAWLDETDDDTFVTGEPSAGTKVTFAVTGERDISLDASRRRVAKGRRVRLFGQISSGSQACSGNQPVRLKARPAGGGRFRTIGTRTTSEGGEYSFRVRVRRTKDYRAIAPANGVCESARSQIVRVRAR